MEMQSFKQTFYYDDNINLEYEVYDQTAFIHSHVNVWKPSVFKKACQVFNTFLTQAKEIGLKRVYTITPNPKYCELFGGVFSNTITVEGREYEVYKWELN